MKKNIAIIIQKLTGGGAEHAAANLSISLSKHYNVFLYVFDTQNITYPYAGTLRSIDDGKGAGFFGKAVHILRRISVVRRLKKQDQIDVSISLLNFANLVNVLSAGKDKTIISIRNNMESLSSKSDRFALSTSMRKADKVVSLSKSVEKQLADRYGCADKISTIYNSVPQLSAGEALYTGAYQTFFVTAGRLTEQKGQWHLIKAMSIVCQKHPEVQLLILGEGELKQKLAQLIASMGLEKNVILYGYCSDPKPIVKASVAFVFPSLFEGLGNAIVEALALGKCVISADCPHGPAELLDDSFCGVRSGVTEAKYGILIPAFDRSVDFSEELAENDRVLAQAMLRVLEDGALREHYQRQAQLRANDFSEDNICSQWSALVEQLS